MHALASFIMHGRVQAIGTVASLAILSLIIPPLGFFATAGVALVKLVQGYREGLTNLVVSAVVVTVFTLLIFGQAAIGLELAMKLLIAWFLAGVVVYKTSMSLAIVAAATLGSLILIGLYFFAEPAAFWYESITKQLLPMLKQAGMQIPEGPEVEKQWAIMSKIMTGSAIALFMIIQVASLLLARWWQAILYNPGGFQKEFHQLHFGVVIAGIASVIIVFAVVSANEIALNLLFIALALMMFQGLAVAHRLVAKCKVNASWLVGVYVIMVFTLLQGAIGVILIAIIGLLDNWLGFRIRMCVNKTHDDMS